MYALLTFCVLSVGLSAYARTLLPELQIIGGNDAPIGEYPYQVSIKSDKFHTCGGSIVSKRYILTAAHCSVNRADDLSSWSIHVGTNFLYQGGKAYKIEKAIPHEQYIRHVKDYDISLLRVTEDIEFNEKVQPIRIASANHGVKGDIAVATGWGGTVRWGGSPNHLQEAFLEIESMERCRAVYPYLNERQICTSTEESRGTCHGDSGGPLVLNGEQIGIVSFGVPCAVGIPDAYTRVYAYRDWILEKIN